MSQPVRSEAGGRILAVASWLAIALAVTVLVAYFAVPWVIQHPSLGRVDMGLALGLSFAMYFVLWSAIVGAPAFALAGLLLFWSRRREALRFLAAAAVCAVPVAMAAWTR